MVHHRNINSSQQKTHQISKSSEQAHRHQAIFQKHTCPSSNKQGTQERKRKSETSIQGSSEHKFITKRFKKKRKIQRYRKGELTTSSSRSSFLRLPESTAVPPSTLQKPNLKGIIFFFLHHYIISIKDQNFVKH